MKICPKCNGEHEKLGTFCSRKCANSRAFSEVSKTKKSISQKKYLRKLSDKEKSEYFRVRRIHFQSKESCEKIGKAISRTAKKKSEQFIQDWLNGLVPMEYTYNGIDNNLSTHIRKYLKEKAGNKCEKCGWCEINSKTGLVPLQTNHIDGDSTNNSPSNLEVICPNCHSLTPTFGRHGKGRKKRYLRVRLTRSKFTYNMSIKYNRKRRLDRKNLMSKIKLERGCVDCGYKENAL